MCTTILHMGQHCHHPFFFFFSPIPRAAPELEEEPTVPLVNGKWMLSYLGLEVLQGLKCRQNMIKHDLVNLI